MSRWKFWEKPIEPPKLEPRPAPVFRIPPRTDALAISPDLNSDAAAKLRRLRQRRASVLYDVERAEEATQPDNAWDQRVALINETIASVDAELQSIDGDRLPAGTALPPTPIERVTVSVNPPPSVAFAIGAEEFRFEEDLDWAERGSQIARSELILRTGDVSAVIPESIAGDERERLSAHLTESLFVFASDLRDRALDERPQPDRPTLADLATPSPEHGGWLDWAKESPEKNRRDARRAELAAELERFRKEQAKEIEERARWEDRLPIAHRRLAEIDAEIAEFLKAS